MVSKVIKNIDLGALAHISYGFLTAHVMLLDHWLGLAMLACYILYQYYDSMRGELWEEMREDILEFTVGVTARAILLALGFTF